MRHQTKERIADTARAIAFFCVLPAAMVLCSWVCRLLGAG